MQAIILAAGMGKRLRELTDNMTKCMVKVNGVTMIERMLRQLDAFSLEKIVIVVGYKANHLCDFISGLDVRTPIEYVENNIYYKTNNIYSLYLARDYLLQSDTLLLESDLIFEDKMLELVLSHNHPSLAVVAKYESWMDGTAVTLEEDNTIRSFLTKKDFKFQDIPNYYKTVNIYKFSKNFSQTHYVPYLEAYEKALGDNEYYEQVLKVILYLEDPEIKAFPIQDIQWYEIDDIQDLDIAESIFAESDSEKLDKITGRYGGYWRYPNLLDFCYLVNPYFPPQKLLDEIKANFDALVTKYPSGQRINSLLAAKYFDVAQSSIAVGNGAAELITFVLSRISGKIGLVLPTFDEYRCRRADDIIAFKPGNPAFSYTADDLTGFFDDKPISALVLINPDNPSGNFIPHDDVLRLALWADKKDIMLILDESFIDFADIDSTMLTNELLTRHPGMVVIKSISKSFGVPGFRLGVFASGNAGIVAAAKKELPVWNINSFAEFYLQICEKYSDDYKKALEMFQPVRDALYNELCNISYLTPIPSKANYITCEVTGGKSSRKLTEYLLSRHNILIKDLCGKTGVPGDYIRVAVKLPQENAKLIDALIDFESL